MPESDWRFEGSTLGMATDQQDGFWVDRNSYQHLRYGPVVGSKDGDYLIDIRASADSTRVDPGRGLFRYDDEIYLDSSYMCYTLAMSATRAVAFYSALNSGSGSTDYAQDNDPDAPEGQIIWRCAVLRISGNDLVVLSDVPVVFPDGGFPSVDFTYGTGDTFSTTDHWARPWRVSDTRCVLLFRNTAEVYPSSRVNAMVVDINGDVAATHDPVELYDAESSFYSYADGNFDIEEAQPQCTVVTDTVLLFRLLLTNDTLGRESNHWIGGRIESDGSITLGTALTEWYELGGLSGSQYNYGAAAIAAAAPDGSGDFVWAVNRWGTTTLQWFFAGLGHIDTTSLEVTVEEPETDLGMETFFYKANVNLAALDASTFVAYGCTIPGFGSWPPFAPGATSVREQAAAAYPPGSKPLGNNTLGQVVYPDGTVALEDQDSPGSGMAANVFARLLQVEDGALAAGPIHFVDSSFTVGSVNYGGLTSAGRDTPHNLSMHRIDATQVMVAWGHDPVIFGTELFEVFPGAPYARDDSNHSLTEYYRLLTSLGWEMDPEYMAASPFYQLGNIYWTVLERDESSTSGLRSVNGINDLFVRWRIAEAPSGNVSLIPGAGLRGIVSVGRSGSRSDYDLTSETDKYIEDSYGYHWVHSFDDFANLRIEGFGDQVGVYVFPLSASRVTPPLRRIQRDDQRVRTAGNNPTSRQASIRRGGATYW